MKTKYLLLLFMMFGVLLSQAQTTVVKGKIVNDEDGEELIGATAIFTGTFVGTQTDYEGNFEISTDDMSLTSITISYVGFEPKDFPITPGQLNEGVFKIKEAKNELVEVEVKAKRRIPKDTAAIALYRKVVKNKVRNDPSNYEYIAYKQYAKTEFGFYDVTEKFKESKIVKKWPFMLENMDTTENGVEVLPVLLKENSKQVYYRKSPKKTKEITLGDRFSGVDNSSISDLFDYNFKPVAIYGNIISVNGKAFMSPFANNARLSYKYFLTDTVMVDGLKCYELQFTGVSNADATFSGKALIHDSTFAIKSIKLVVLPNANINYVSDLIIEQDFTLIDGKNWIKSREFLQTEYNIVKRKDKGKERQSILVRKTTQRDNISVNEPIPNSLFDGEEVVILEGARERDETFWDTSRVEELERHEQGIFETVDSIKTTPFYKMISWFTYLGTTGWMDAKYVDFGQIYNIYSWNDIEGSRIRLGMRTTKKTSKVIQLMGYGAYGTKDKTWKYGAYTRIHLPTKNERWHMLGFRHTYDMKQLRDYNPIMRPTPVPYDNIAFSLLRTSPLDDLFLQRHSQIFYEKEWIKGLNTRFAVDHKINSSVNSGIVFSTTSETNPNDTIRINDFTTTEASFSLVWGKELKFFLSNGGFRRFPVTVSRPILKFDYTAGIKGVLGSDYNFHKLHIGVQQRWLNPIGYTVYRADAGIVFGDAPYPLQTIHRGNETFLYNKFAFNAMNESEFISDKYVQLSVVHHFDGLIFNKIPGIKKLQIRALISGRILYGHLSEKNAKLINLPQNSKALNGIYAEAGFGIENILKLLRADMIFRITQRGQPDVSKFVFRFTIAPAF